MTNEEKSEEEILDKVISDFRASFKRNVQISSDEEILDKIISDLRASFKRNVLNSSDEEILKIISDLRATFKKDVQISSEEERYVLEKTALSYCKGGIDNCTDLKKWFQLSSTDFLFAFGEIEEATKGLVEKLESVSKEDDLFTKCLVTFYSKEYLWEPINKALQSFVVFFSENAKFRYALKSPENEDAAFISIIAQ